MKNKTKYLCRLVLAALFAVTLIGPMTPANAYRRSASGEAMTVTEDNGNTLTPYNVSVGTTTPVAVYTKTASRVDRSFSVCNDQADTYRLLLSTTSAAARFTGTATQDTDTHYHVAPNTCVDMVAPAQSIYAVFRSSSDTGTFSGGRAYGFKRYDSRD